MHLLRAGTPLFLLAVLSGAAGRCGAQPAPTRPSSNDRAAAIAAAGIPVRWQATLQATQQRTGGVAPTVRNRTTGYMYLSPAGSERTRVRLTLSTTGYDGSALRWAILPGRCGSDMVPIAPVERFPIIDIGANGRGELDMELAITMPATGQYHVNVYRGRGTQLSNVLTCGNLTRAR
ncbi:MAG: hypothetical protein NUW01_12680 [Gemmatimonadaceae bacterium]|nr:hypothetical protein [Gemmatimonadaceae bacterium]